MEDYELLAKRSEKFGYAALGVLLGAVAIETLAMFLVQIITELVGASMRTSDEILLVCTMLITTTVIPPGIIFAFMSIGMAGNSQLLAPDGKKLGSASMGFGCGLGALAIAIGALIMNATIAFMIWVLMPMA
ncbi:MAG: hypothetical protein LBS74_07210 [Oscillospiraceae bacterium]|jgi:hypothetical protein|nr:hypothetical protein [Oscillospiraceae bacterium]